MKEAPAALDDPFFFKCLDEAAKNKELIAQYDRLNGTNLALRGTGLDLEIDRATGRLDQSLAGFVKFVHDVVYLPLLA